MSGRSGGGRRGQGRPHLGAERLEERRMLANPGGGSTPAPIELAAGGVLTFHAYGLKSVGAATLHATIDSATVDAVLDVTVAMKKVGVNTVVPIIEHWAKSFPASSVASISYFGGTGDDTFIDDAAVPCTARGNAGDDTLVGGSHADTLVGGLGADRLEGRGGDDSLQGSVGSDRYVFASGSLGTDTIVEAAALDADSLDFSGMAVGVTIDLSKAGAQVVAGMKLSVVLSSPDAIENVAGTSQADTITGNGRPNVIRGGGGDDVLVAKGVTGDTIEGEAGDDTILGSLGPDTLRGGDGIDSIDGLEGNDTIFGGAGFLDTLVGGPGNDQIHGEGGIDVIQGGAGNDKIWGDAGSDRIHGDAGNDTIDGGTEDDSLYGDAGDDSLSGGDGSDQVYGGVGNDTLSGGKHADRLEGEDGNDTLNGDDGTDRLLGGAGNDVLAGGAGNDGLSGGTGVDKLTGGAGADRFLQQKHKAGNEDTILDRSVGTDATITFADTFGAYVGFDWMWTAQTWKPEEIALVDIALGQLHARTGNTKLLRLASGADFTFSRIGTPASFVGPGTTTLDKADAILAWNDGSGMAFNDSTFVPRSGSKGDISVPGGDQSFFLQIIQHEIGHNWDNVASFVAAYGADGVKRYDEFKALSAWLYASSANVPAGFIASGNGPGTDGWGWYYFWTSTFANDYGKSNPDEDFATAFESDMAKWAGRSFIGDGVRDVPAKWAVVDALIAKLS